MIINNKYNYNYHDLANISIVIDAYYHVVIIYWSFFIEPY